MYRGLDAFRALAFFAVFAAHCGLFSAGYLGVQAFFVLSGFLLTPILLSMSEQMDARTFFRNFYGRRSLRIFPLYYLYILVVLCACLVIVNIRGYGQIENVDRFLEQLPWTVTYTYNLFHATRFFNLTQLCSHFWSLAVEEQFYLVWPVIIFVMDKRYIKHILLFLIALGPMLRLLVIIAYESNLFSILLPQLDLLIYVLPTSYVDAFAIGGYFALYKKSDDTSLRTMLYLYSAICFGYLMQYLLRGELDITSFGYAPYMIDQPVLGYSIINFVFANIILQTRDGNFFPFIMNNNIMAYLGKISYGMYVFHHAIIWVVHFSNPSLTNTQIAPIAFLLTVGISAAVYEIYEKKFLRLKDIYFPHTLPS